MEHRFVTLVALGIIGLAAVLAVSSALGDSLVIDELAHLPAGYTYVTRAEMRLNPEHPPLVKDAAGLMVLLWSKITGHRLVVPDQIPAWKTETNGEWVFGYHFFHNVNPSADGMILAGRLPTIASLLALLWLIFTWTRQRYGQGTALLALGLTSLSPTLLAHGRYVTTDVPAALAFFGATIAFLAWLEQPTRGRLLLAGLVFGLAQLVKFSLIILGPLFAALVLFRWAFGSVGQAPAPLRDLSRQLGHYGLLLAVAFGLVVTPVYALQTSRYPVEKQRQDLDYYRREIGPTPLLQTVRWSVDKPLLQSLGHYLTGLALVENRSRYGSTTYFLGEVTVGGRSGYFPLVYLLKEPLPFHLLTLFALGLAAVAVGQALRQQRLTEGLSRQFPLVVFLLVVSFYWLVSVQSELNIGVRHVLPTIPFVAVLASVAVSGLLVQLRRWRFAERAGLGLVGLLLAWQALSIVKVHPAYLAYFNELAGGPAGGVRFVADSNLDWGQDLKRLARFVDERGINRIAVDYFGGDSPARRLPGIAYDHNAEDPPVTGWIAISQTYLTQERGQPAPNVRKEPNRYAWLDRFDPVATIGHSMVVYFIPPQTDGDR